MGSAIAEASGRNASWSSVCWAGAAAILTFFCLTQFAVQLCFLFGRSISPILTPAALVLSLVLAERFGRRLGLRGLHPLWPPAILLGSFALSILAAAPFYDLSWDGQWYHQMAVYHMARDWNPLKDPLRAFGTCYEPWLRHYAKGGWYFAAAVLQATHHIEWAKCGNGLASAAMFLAVLGAGLDLGLRRGHAVTLAALFTLNPVNVFELCTFQLDGVLAAFLTCCLAAWAAFFRRGTWAILLVAVEAGILVINTKFNGLVYLVFLAAAGGLYALARRRDLLRQYVLAQAASIAFGAAVIGYNPYVTNTVYRGNPFYPIMGEAKYPLWGDLIENVETPVSMKGRNRLVRYGYALFGRPGIGENPRVMWPMTATWKEFRLYYFHDVRISGFGPWFSGAFIAGLFLLLLALARPRAPRGTTILVLAAIVASLLVSKHGWWARYGPQLWWFPIAALVPGWLGTASRPMRWMANALAALLLVNAIVIEAVHVRWEVEATRTLGRQLRCLRKCGPVDVNLEMFPAVGERLRTAGIDFRTPSPYGCSGREFVLTSVCAGYPGAVHVCIHDPKVEWPTRGGADYRIGRRLTLRAAGAFVCADLNLQPNTLVADREKAAGWEQFDEVLTGEGRVLLRALANDQWVGVDRDGALTADDRCRPVEIVAVAEGRIALRTGDRAAAVDSATRRLKAVPDGSESTFVCSIVGP